MATDKFLSKPNRLVPGDPGRTGEGLISRYWEAPVVQCRGGCGRRRRTWRETWLCRFCLLADRAAFPESFLVTRRRLAGRCAVCGGPWPDGSGCEFCPKSEQPGRLQAAQLREEEVRR